MKNAPTVKTGLTVTLEVVDHVGAGAIVLTRVSIALIDVLCTQQASESGPAVTIEASVSVDTNAVVTHVALVAVAQCAFVSVNLEQQQIIN